MHREVRRYGAFAEVFATVQSPSGDPAGPADGTGIDSLHLVGQDGRWRIAARYCALERPDPPRPAEWGRRSR